MFRKSFAAATIAIGVMGGPGLPVAQQSSLTSGSLITAVFLRQHRKSTLAIFLRRALVSRSSISTPTLRITWQN